MKLAWFSAALSTVLLTGVCAHAQEAGVFHKWLNERSPTCVPVSEFKSAWRSTQPGQSYTARAVTSWEMLVRGIP